MIERIALVLLLSVTSVAAFYALRAAHVRCMRSAVSRSGTAVPTLLYFRGDHCAVCPTQERAINQAAAEWDGLVRVERIDAENDPDTAARYSVFTLPTTIWLDQQGQARQINYGLADARKLARQAADYVEQASDAQEKRQTTGDRPQESNGQPPIAPAPIHHKQLEAHP